MVNTREDAQNLLAYTHQAWRGTRSFGPVRALLDGARTIRNMPATRSAPSP